MTETTQEHAAATRVLLLRRRTWVILAAGVVVTYVIMVSFVGGVPGASSEIGVQLFLLPLLPYVFLGLLSLLAKSVERARVIFISAVLLATGVVLLLILVVWEPPDPQTSIVFYSVPVLQLCVCAAVVVSFALPSKPDRT